MEYNTVELDSIVPHTLCLDETQFLIDILTESEDVRRASSPTCYADEPPVHTEIHSILNLDHDTYKTHDADIVAARIFPTHPNKHLVPTVTSEDIQTWLSGIVARLHSIATRTFEVSMKMFVILDSVSENILVRLGSVCTNITSYLQNSYDRNSLAVRAPMYALRLAPVAVTHGNDSGLSNAKKARRAIRIHEEGTEGVVVVRLQRKQHITVQSPTCATKSITVHYEEKDDTDTVSFGQVARAFASLIIEGRGATIDSI